MRESDVPEGASHRLRAALGLPRATFGIPLGRRLDPVRPRGYHLDFSVKAQQPGWPESWFAPGTEYVAAAQWGLGAFERFLAGEGERWLAGALAAGDSLLTEQQRGGPLDGAWLYRVRAPRDFPLPVPWPSAMAQGEGASLLVRLRIETGEERFADGALRALAPLTVPVAEGGVLETLDGDAWYEEYPTRPPSFVLNGLVFALWGLHDVGLGLADERATQAFAAGAAMLAANIGRWDTGRWSRYDLLPRRLPHVASPAYHELHITQLRALAALAPHAELDAACARFEGYASRRSLRARAFGAKVAFRLAGGRSAPGQQPRRDA